MVKKPIYLKSLSPEEKKKFREKYDYLFFDKDGTIEQITGEIIPGVPEAIATVAARCKKVHIFTDSCLHHRETIADYLKARYPGFEKENIVTAPVVLAEHLKKIGFQKKIYAIGSDDGLIRELREAGFEVLADSFSAKYIVVKDLANIKLETGVGAVVVGADLNFNYIKLLKAVNYLRDPSVLFFATHYHLFVHNDPIIPAAGALYKSVAAIANREPLCCSKSTDSSVEYIHSLGYDVKRCLFVGDVIQADIKCGNRSGMDTLLVLCGYTKKENLEDYFLRGDDELIPTYITDSTADLADFLCD